MQSCCSKKKNLWRILNGSFSAFALADGKGKQVTALEGYEINTGCFKQISYRFLQSSELFTLTLDALFLKLNQFLYSSQYFSVLLRSSLARGEQFSI